jgi:hypothetical protein
MNVAQTKSFSVMQAAGQGLTD